MSGVRTETKDAGCRISGGQAEGEFIRLSNQERFPAPLLPPIGKASRSLSSAPLSISKWNTNIDLQLKKRKNAIPQVKFHLNHVA